MESDKASTTYSEPDYAKAQDRTKAPFYHPNIDDKISPETQELLERYSHVPLAQQSKHVHNIAWQIRAYPCTGTGVWLTPQLRRLPIYSDILKQVQNGAVVVDVGTFIGHDLRRLAYDGAPSDRLYGIDIVSHFDVGYNFFRDRDRFQAHFIEADFLSITDSELAPPELMALRNLADFVIVSQLLHQWNWDGQLRACIALTSLTFPGSWIVGNQISNSTAQNIKTKNVPQGVWRHNLDSFTAMWAQVGVATKTKWEVQTWMRSFEDMGWHARDSAWMEPGVGVIEFAVQRTA